MANYSHKVSNILCTTLYKTVSESLDKNTDKFIGNIAKFMNKNHDKIHDIAPYDNIYFTKTDIDDMFKSMNLAESDVDSIMKDCYFYNVPINPECVKEPYVETLIQAIRYFVKNNQTKRAELTAIYLVFSGKFYASIFQSAFPSAPPSKYRAIMDYVVNNMLTDKFDLKKEGTVFGAIKSMCITWLGTYNKYFTDSKSTDEDMKMIIQQLRDRLKSFIHNIMELYYEAYNNKLYMNYETDSNDTENFRLADNDAVKAARITENVMNYMTSNKVSLQICNKCKDQYVKATEICAIMEAILADNNNLPNVKRAVNIIICDFLRKYPGGSIKSIDFVSYTIKAKPNSKDQYHIELKKILCDFLDANSVAYRRKSDARKASYYRSILMYFAFVINKVAT